MKDQILKIAKVKSEKEFYKKYPTEEAFMKDHGKAFKKAAMGSKMVNNQLHDLTSWDNPAMAQDGKEIKKYFGGGGVNASNWSSYGIPGMSTATYDASTGLVNNASGVVSKADTDALGFTKNAPGAGGFDAAGAGMAALGALPGIIAGAEAIGAQKKAIKKADQASRLSGLAAQAAGMRERIERKYVRPEDSLLQPGQLGNPYGAGTNFLAQNGKTIDSAGIYTKRMLSNMDMADRSSGELKNKFTKEWQKDAANLERYKQKVNKQKGKAESGKVIRDGIGGNPTEIQNTYAPTGDIYQDLGYEPLSESVYKQYRHGGELPKAELGDYFQDSGQAQIGSSVGTAAGTLIAGPLGGMVGGLIGKAAGNLLGGAKDARELAKFKGQTEANTQQAAWQNTLQGQFSGFMEDGGKVGNEYKWVSHTWEPQVIAKFGDYDVKDLLKPPHDADMLRSGGHLAQVHYTPPSAEALFTGRPDMPQAQLGLIMGPINKGMIDTVQNSEQANKLKQAVTSGMFNTGGRLPSTNMMFDTDKYPRAQDGVQLAMGGDLEVGDGGHLETLSYNPNLPGGEIGMFRGASHDNGGIKTKYGENEVEVEGNEPVVKLQDGGSTDNLVVFGNIKINKEIADLMGDPKAKGKKFKTYIADVAKNDAKQMKRMNKGLEIINDATDNSARDHLAMNTGQAMLDGATAWQKINAAKIKEAGVVQDSIHQVANAYGVKSDKLAEGKFEKETDPSMMGKNGKKMKKAQVGLSSLKGLDDEALLDPAHPERMELLKAYYSGNEADRKMIAQGLNKPGMMGVGANELDPVVVTSNRKLSNKLPMDIIPYERKSISSSVPDYIDPNTLPNIQMAASPSGGESGGFSLKNINWDKLGDIGKTALSYAAPWLRPSNANEPLSPDQLYPEYFALANNQIEPVKAQTFQPMLDTPYDISLNDQINAVDSQARAAIRAAGQNPASQALIMTQALETKNKILGEQSRINQANKMGVYAKNRELLNDAQLKNLGILDNQYVRQSQAKSNTKEQALEALKSIAAKTAQQRAVNRKIGVMENMYNYRFSPSGRAYNVNLPAQFNLSGSMNQSGSTKTDAYGNPMYPIYNPKTGKIKGYSVGESGSTADDDLNPFKNGGKTSKNKARNSSIVKALKNL